MRRIPVNHTFNTVSRGRCFFYLQIISSVVILLGELTSLRRVDGAIAQLGERLHGMQEVVSSNLIGSIFFFNFTEFVFCMESGYTHIFRVMPGRELGAAVSAYCEENDIKSAVVTGIIGSLTRASLGFLKKLPGEYIRRDFDGPLEIASAQGTVGTCEGQRVVHIHLVISNETSAVGGHLVSGEVFSTAEVVLQRLEKPIERQTDDYTGLKELSC